MQERSPAKIMKKLIAVCWLALGSLSAVVAADFDVRKPEEFQKLLPSGAKVEKLSTGFGFLEGPVWVSRSGGFLVFSDIPANELKKWTAKEGVTTYRKPSNNANGNTIDRKGNLISCEHSGRKVVLENSKGEVKPLIETFDGKKFNSPNDAAVKSDGTIWFTDPDYGLGKNPHDVAGLYVYRFDPKSHEVRAVIKDFDKPNGLCFSPDEKKLYIADSGKPHHIRVFDVQKDGTLANGKVFCDINSGVPDGIRCDKEGRVWSSAGDGVHIFAVDGSLIAKILVPEAPANLCFGGKSGKTLFITACTSLYAIETTVKGAP
ncbi:MAG: Gluconolactonase [Verrucomicrobiales bacterium]|nr:Gluconolactonase [Verrucomicrobiales bacterium]